jgi:uncharacterized protein (DUF58 family)
MRPTGRAAVFVGAAVPVALIVAVVFPEAWPFGLAFLAGALVSVGLDALMSLPPRALGVAWKLPAMLYIGSSDPAVFTLTSTRGGRPVPVELALDADPRLRPPPRVRAIVSPGGSAEIGIRLRPLRRGMAEVERLWLRWQGPMGLVWRHSEHLIEAEIPVLPNVRAVRAAAIRFFARDAPTGQKTQSQQGDGSEFDALRDYVPGLDRRSVDWKHSARHRKLVCKEFKAERNHNIVLAFDTGHLMSEPLDGVARLDRAINASLLLAYASLREGDRVGLFGFDAQVRLYTEPASGLQNFTRVQHAAAELEYRPEETNYTLGLTHLSARLKRRSLVVLMTDFIDTVTAEMMVENLARLTQRHLVMFVSFVDPALALLTDAVPASVDAMARATVAGDFVRERAVVMERLARLGVHCLDVRHEAVNTEMVNRYLLIKRRELI